MANEIRLKDLIVTEQLSWDSTTQPWPSENPNNTSQRLLVSLNQCVIENVLTYCLAAWVFTCTKAKQEVFQRVIKTAGNIIRTEVPDITTFSTARCLQQSLRILIDSFHLFQHHFPSGKGFRSIKARTSRISNSFYPQAIRFLNSFPLQLPLALHFIT